MLESPEPVSLTFLTAKGEIRHFEKCVGLKRNHYAGTRNIKNLQSESFLPDIRTIRDCLIIDINGCEVFI